MGSFRARWLATTPTWCAGSSPSAHRQRVGPVHTTFGRAYSASELARIAEAAEERAARPIAVPLTAIRSRRKGIVAPDACVDNRTPGAENLVVGSTHIGMGLDPDVWRIVADRLVRPDAPGALRRRGAASMGEVEAGSSRTPAQSREIGPLRAVDMTRNNSAPKCLIATMA